MPGPAIPSLLARFAALDDPRQQAKVLYPLPEILLLLLCATLAGADDLAEIELWGREQLAFLRGFLTYEHGVPSHDTLGCVLAALDAELLKACFAAWVEGLRETAPDLVAIEPASDVIGGQVLAAQPRPEPGPRAAASGLRLGQPSAPGARAGGPGRQVERDHRHPAALKDVEAFFADPPPGTLDTGETTDGEHGRIEVRQHMVGHEVAWLFSDRRYPGEIAFPGLAMVGMVEATTEREGRISREQRYYLSSARLAATTFAHAVRGHWGIENWLH